MDSSLSLLSCGSPEAAIHRCSSKKVFLKISQYLQRNTCFRASFLIYFIKTRLNTCVFLRILCNFKKSFFVENLLWRLLGSVEQIGEAKDILKNVCNLQKDSATNIEFLQPKYFLNIASVTEEFFDILKIAFCNNHEQQPWEFSKKIFKTQMHLKVGFLLGMSLLFFVMQLLLINVCICLYFFI